MTALLGRLIARIFMGGEPLDFEALDAHIEAMGAVLRCG